MIKRLARLCYRRRRSVVMLWLAAVVLLGAASGAVGTRYVNDFGLPDVESRRGIDLLEAEFGGQGAGISGSMWLERTLGRPESGD